MLCHFLVAVAFVGVSLGAGMIGYLYFEHDHVKTWRDAFLNAGMLLGGMGPVHNPATDGGKVFAGPYAQRLALAIGQMVIAHGSAGANQAELCLG